MKLAVLCSPESWSYGDLVRAAGDAHDVVSVGFYDLSAAVDAGRSTVSATTAPGKELAGCDAVLVRAMPPGSLEQVVFRMDALARLEAAGAAVVNPPRAIEAAVDKYLATARLQEAGLLTPRTYVCQSAEQAMDAFERLRGDVVVKPLFGSEGRGITRIQDEAIAQRSFRLLERLGAVLYVQEFIPHDGCDLRLLALPQRRDGQRPRILGMRRRNASDWRTNASRGAACEPLEVTAQLAELAVRAAECIGAVFAGVDFLPGRDGRLYAIEVNAAPGWKATSRATGADVATALLDYLAAVARRPIAT